MIKAVGPVEEVYFAPGSDKLLLCCQNGNAIVTDKTRIEHGGYKMAMKALLNLLWAGDSEVSVISYPDDDKLEVMVL